MGSPVSPIVVNLYMEKFENKALSTFNDTSPANWFRYVDDTWCRLKKRVAADFFDHINQIDDNIKFTQEPSHDNILPFLDTKTVVEEDGNLRFEVYRKPTHTDQYLAFDSHHPLEHKLAVIKTLFHHADNIITSDQAKTDEHKHLRGALAKCGYQNWTFNKALKPSNQSKKTQKCKPLTNKNKVNITIPLKCEEPNCNNTYIGETSRPLEVRYKEHCRPSANDYSSAIFQHLQHNQGHSFKFESTDILDRETRWWERGVKEAIYERMYNPTLNREGGLRVDLSGTCEQCPARAAPANGAVTPTGAVSYPNGVTFTCNSGYVRNGAASATCQADGTWSDHVPTCNHVQCPGRAAPANGALTSTGMVFYPNGVVFSCNSGFTLNGQATPTCQADGTWSHPVPTCSRKKSDPQTVSKAMKHARDSQGQRLFRVNDFLTTQQVSSYFSRLAAKRRKTTEDDEDQQLDPAVLESINTRQCPALTAPPFGVLRPIGARSYQDTVTFECDQGYTLNGATSATCQADETWSNPVPTCTPVQCPARAAPANGAVTPTRAVSYPNGVTFTCNSGYTLNGQATPTCQADGTWSHPAPTCQAKACPQLPILNNGNRTEGHRYGDKVIFSCDEGYELIGSENRTCQADQTWSGVQPNCNSYELIGSENRTCRADQTWSGVQPNCNKKLCQQLMAPSNGNISGNSSYGDVVTYHCDPGYEISGDKQRTCQSDQTWSGTQPTCVGCVPDISLSGGGSSESSAVKIARRTAFTIRSRINVICNQTYRVTYEWNIFQHDPMGNVVQIPDFPNKVVRDSQDITIPGNSLGYGFTFVELNATMDFPTTGNKKSKVQKQWFVITPSAPVAHIAGGSAKSASRDGVLVLNASESYDPDEYIDDLRNFTFHWTCQTINGTSCNDIFPDARQSDAEYELQTASFSNGVDTVTFTVEVGLPGRNSSRTSQSVTLLDGVVLNIAIRCAANCETKVSPSERLVLVTQCDDCPTANTTYLWTLTGDKHIDWDVDTTTGNTSPNLVVRSNIFEAGESYTFRINVTSNVAPGGTGFSEHSFRVNKPPTIGSCAEPTMMMCPWSTVFILTTMWVTTPTHCSIRER
ncbi:hypothetical protein Bbelb_116780 [Branchiostoma belcheri]|nr:hypothetical protein Bbelb_116780 [Branchiostoma belcheri]